MKRSSLVCFAVGAALVSARVSLNGPATGAPAPTPSSHPVAPSSRPALPPVSGWKAQADPPAEMKGRFRGDLKVSAPIKGGNKLAASNRPGPFIAIADDNWGDQNFSLLDLRTGAMTPGPRGKMGLEEPSISPDGQYLVGRARRTPGEDPGLAVYSFKTKQIVRHLLPAERSFRPPTVIGFLDGDRLLTYANKDFKPLLEVWDIKGGKVAAQVKPEKLEISQVSISPGGKFFAFANETSLAVYTAAGEEAGSVPMPPFTEPGWTELKPNPKHVAFAPEGDEVAAFCEVPWHDDKRRIVAWDLASGQIVRDLIIPKPGNDRRNRENSFEYLPGGLGWRFERSILESESGKSVYDIPQSRPGHEDDLIHVVDADHVLEVSEKEFGGKAVQISMVKLPHDELEKATAAVRAGGSGIDAKLPPLTAADWSKAKTLEPTKEATWSVAPDVATSKSSEPASPAAKSIPLQIKGVDAAPVRVVFAHASAGLAAVTFHAPAHGAPVQKSIIQRISLATKQASAIVEMDLDAEALDISADGKLVLLRTGADRVDLYSVASAAKPLCGWRPYDKLPPGGAGTWTFSGRAANDVAWGAIVNDTHVLTCSGSGKLALWSVPACKADWSMPIFVTVPQLSPNRKLIAAVADGFLELLDSQTGETRGAIAVPKTLPTGDRLAFRPDGKRLLRTLRSAGTILTVWDMANGKIANETFLSGKFTPEIDAAWCGDRHVLLGRGSLVDLNLHIPVWQYTADMPGEPIPNQPAGQVDGRLWQIVNGTPPQVPSLMAFDLPHSDAKKLEATLSPDTVLAIKPGTKVSVQTTLVGDADNQQKVVAALKEHLAAAGLVYAEGQPIQLVASVTQRGTRKMQYIMFGGNKATESIDIPEYVAKLSFAVGGKDLWFAESNAGGSAPMHVTLQKGETIQSYIAKINANPGSWFFQNNPVPGWVGKPLDSLNTSKLTQNGIVAADRK